MIDIKIPQESQQEGSSTNDSSSASSLSHLAMALLLISIPPEQVDSLTRQFDEILALSPSDPHFEERLGEILPEYSLLDPLDTDSSLNDTSTVGPHDSASQHGDPNLNSDRAAPRAPTTPNVIQEAERRGRVQMLRELMNIRNEAQQAGMGGAGSRFRELLMQYVSDLGTEAGSAGMDGNLEQNVHGGGAGSGRRGGRGIRGSPGVWAYWAQHVQQAHAQAQMMRQQQFHQAQMNQVQ